jgi:hypothetical protein
VRGEVGNAGARHLEEAHLLVDRDDGAGRVESSGGIDEVAVEEVMQVLVGRIATSTASPAGSSSSLPVLRCEIRAASSCERDVRDAFGDGRRVARSLRTPAPCEPLEREGRSSATR